MKDYVGQWFEIYRRLNEPADIVIEIEKNANIEVRRYPHEEVDGAGALFLLAEEKKWVLQNLAKSSKYNKIPIYKYFLNLLLFLYWTRPRKKTTWNFKIEKSKDDVTLYSSARIDREGTLKLKAKKIDVSLNTLLFHSLNSVLAEKFNFDSTLKSWWIPVNMRPDLNLDLNELKNKRNYVSNFTVSVNHLMSLKDYQSFISKYLKQKRHLATWWWQHLGKYLPESVLEKIVTQQLKTTQYIGAFSNLGEWNSSDQESRVTFFVNPIRSHPIGASVLIWNGELSVGLQVYPTFPLTQIELDLMTKNWVEKTKLISGL